MKEVRPQRRSATSCGSSSGSFDDGRRPLCGNWTIWVEERAGLSCILDSTVGLPPLFDTAPLDNRFVEADFFFVEAVFFCVETVIFENFSDADGGVVGSVITLVGDGVVSSALSEVTVAGGATSRRCKAPFAGGRAVGVEKAEDRADNDDESAISAICIFSLYI